MYLKIDVEIKTRLQKGSKLCSSSNLKRASILKTEHSRVVRNFYAMFHFKKKDKCDIAFCGVITLYGLVSYSEQTGA